jgi:hypothetical protein
VRKAITDETIQGEVNRLETGSVTLLKEIEKKLVTNWKGAFDLLEKNLKPGKVDDEHGSIKENLEQLIELGAENKVTTARKTQEFLVAARELQDKSDYCIRNFRDEEKRKTAENIKHGAALKEEQFFRLVGDYAKNRELIDGLEKEVESMTERLVALFESEEQVATAKPAEEKPKQRPWQTEAERKAEKETQMQVMQAVRKIDNRLRSILTDDNVRDFLVKELSRLKPEQVAGFEYLSYLIESAPSKEAADTCGLLARYAIKELHSRPRVSEEVREALGETMKLGGEDAGFYGREAGECWNVLRLKIKEIKSRKAKAIL